MKKSYSALVQPMGEINQFATISTDGQVLLWEKKFLDPQKKPITDVNYTLFSMLLSIGKQDMASTYSVQKEEELWGAPILLLIVMKRELYSQEQQIKESYLFVIGQHVQLMKQEAKMILLLAFGVNKDALDLL